MSRLLNITLLYRPKRKNRWSKSRALKAKVRPSPDSPNNLWGSIKPPKKWTKQKRSRKLFSNAYCARLQAKSQKWRHVPIANIIFTWAASKTTMKSPRGTFATNVVLNEINKCGSNKGGFYRSKNWWLKNFKNWCQRRHKNKRKKRNTQSAMGNSQFATLIMYRMIRNLNIRYKINS